MPQIQNVFSNQTTRGGTAQRQQLSLDQMVARVDKMLATNVNLTPRAIRHARTPMIITTKYWMRQNKIIRLFVNPSDMRWSLPRRGTVVKTAAGTVRNVWRNRYRGTYYDEGTVGITFQTGNILPGAAWQNNELEGDENLAGAVLAPRVPAGLEDFYRFTELLDAPMLLGAAENYHYIFHHSRVFPSIHLIGYFTEDSFTFSEMATDGNRLQWEATFQIYSTSPRIGRAADLIGKYTNYIDTNRDEQFGQDNMARYIYREGVSDLPKGAPAGQPKVKAASTAGSPFNSLSIKSVTSSTSKSKVVSGTAQINPDLLATVRGD